MQLQACKAGEEQWKILTLPTWTQEMALQSSEYSMAMEVLQQSVKLYYEGSEVAMYVEKHFIKELKKLESFKKTDYRASLIEIFLKMD